MRRSSKSPPLAGMAAWTVAYLSFRACRRSCERMRWVVGVGPKRDSPDLGNLGLQLGAGDVLETEQAPEQRVDEVARIHGRRLLRTQRTRQQQRRPQDGRPCLHFTSTTSRGSFRSKAPAGR